MGTVLQFVTQNTVCSKEADFQITHHDISDTVDIVGFLDVSDVSSPTSLSRHLVLPTSAHGRFPTGGMEGMNLTLCSH